MTEKQIIDFYDRGFSIDFITDLYYRDMQKNIKGHYLKGEYIIDRSEYKKSRCKQLVYEILYNYNKKK